MLGPVHCHDLVLAEVGLLKICDLEVVMLNIFDDIAAQDLLYKQLEKDGMIRGAFEKSVIEELVEWGWYEELYDDQKEPNFSQLQELPFFIIFINEYKRDSVRLLLESYDPLNAVKNAGHFFDFLVIDTQQKLVCGIGLGRKNRIFCACSESGGAFTYDNTETKKKLSANMPWDVVSSLHYTLESLGDCFFKRDSIPGNEELLQEALDRGPDDEDQYFLEDDDEAHSEGEIRSYLSDYAIYTENIEDTESELRIYFPSLQVSELNTGDY